MLTTEKRIIRFIIMEKRGGWVASVFAERYEIYAGVGNSFTGASLGNFYLGSEIVGRVDASRFIVLESGEIMPQPKIA
jgi:hypothetical protein